MLGKYKGKNVEDIIQRSIESKLRMEWASDFFDFYNLQTLTPEEVVKGVENEYNQANLRRDTSERFAYMTALLTADETQVEACRNIPPTILVVPLISELQEMELSLYQSKEFKQYAKDGITSYGDIGNLYNNYLLKTSTKKIRGEDNERG